MQKMKGEESHYTRMPSRKEPFPMPTAYLYSVIFKESCVQTQGNCI